MICEMYSPFTGQDINQVPIETLERWLLITKEKLRRQKREPREHVKDTIAAVETRVNKARLEQHKSPETTTERECVK